MAARRRDRRNNRQSGLPPVLPRKIPNGASDFVDVVWQGVVDFWIGTASDIIDGQTEAQARTEVIALLARGNGTRDGAGRDGRCVGY
jgi:hypothetical protein